MISRRLVRIKAMQTYYAFLQSEEEWSSEKIQKNLEINIENSYDLYIYIHCLMIAISDHAKKRIEISKNKHIPTFDDLNPNTRFINNSIIKSFRENEKISEYYSNQNYNWSEYETFIKQTWTKISNSEFYQNYMEKPETTIKDDIKIISKILSKTIADNPKLDEILEDKNIYWNDDLEFLISNIIQNIKKLSGTEENKYDLTYQLQTLYKNATDERFAKNLITKTALNKTKFDKIILDTLKKWELERIAFTDRVLLHLAFCEIYEFPELPVKVTINEYLDIAKCYSTEKSNIFINGILDKVYMKLKSENKLNKKGLGLVE